MSDKRFDYEERTPLKLKPWIAPSFAVVDDPSGGERSGIHVSELPYDTLEAMIQHWANEVRAIASIKSTKAES